MYIMTLTKYNFSTITFKLILFQALVIFSYVGLYFMFEKVLFWNSSTYSVGCQALRAKGRPVTKENINSVVNFLSHRVTKLEACDGWNRDEYKM